MSLTELPVEILQNIAGLTMPEGYESFMCSCRMLHSTGEIHRAKHNNFVKRYRDFGFEQPVFLPAGSGWNRQRVFPPSGPNDSGCKTPFDLIMAIYNEPLIAKYIVRPNFLIDDSINTKDSSMRAMAQFSPEVLEKGIYTLAEQSSYLKECNIGPEAMCSFLMNEYNGVPNFQRVNSQERFFSIVFLLTLLPNSEVLTLPRNWIEFPSLFNSRSPKGPSEQAMIALLNAITANANDGGDGTPLSKLHTVNPSFGTGYEMRSELQMFCPFLDIKSLRTFRCGGCSANSDGYTGRPFHPELYLHLGTNLETLELAGICTSANDFRKFLTRCPKLRVLRLAYEVKWHGSGYCIDAGALVAMIEEETKSTLEVLSLSMMGHFASVATGVVSMNKFEKLTELEFDMKLLLGPPYTGLPEDRWAVSPTGPKPKPEELNLPKMVDLLPASCEKANLISESSELYLHSWKSLLVGFESERYEKLPKLKETKVTLVLFDGRSQSELEELLDLETWNLEVKSFAGVRSRNHIFKEAEFLKGYDERWGVIGE